MALRERLLIPAVVGFTLASPACGESPEGSDRDGASGSPASGSGGAAAGVSGSSSGGNTSAGTSGLGGSAGTAGMAGSGAASGVGSGGSSGASTGGTSGASTGGTSGASTGGTSGSSTGGSGAGGAGAGGTNPGGTSGASTGGSSGTNAGGRSGASGASGAAGGGNFTLVWRDDFNSFDTGRWSTASHTFTENLATFTPANAVVEGGFLKLRLTAAPGGGEKPYLSAEVRTNAEFTYGRFETRARFAHGSGLVSSLFTFYDHLPMDWNEIDVEFLGRYNDRVQYNTIFWDSAQARQTHEHMDTLGFDPSTDFHVYTIEWIPGAVRFLVDGQLRHTETAGISTYMKLPQKVMMNLWPANVVDWVGPVDAGAIPAESHYDWVSVYAYAP